MNAQKKFAIQNLKAELPHMEDRNLLNTLLGDSYEYLREPRRVDLDYIKRRIGLEFNEVLRRMAAAKEAAPKQPQCRAVWRAGVLRPPDGPVQPPDGARCVLELHGEDIPHDYRKQSAALVAGGLGHG